MPFFNLSKIKKSVTFGLLSLACEAYAAVDSLRGTQYSHDHYPCTYDIPQGVFEIAETGFYYMVRIQQSSKACMGSLVSNLRNAIPKVAQYCADLTQHEQVPSDSIIYRDWKSIGPRCTRSSDFHCYAAQNREVILSESVNTSLPIIQESVECIEGVLSDVVDSSQKQALIALGITATVLIGCCCLCVGGCFMAKCRSEGPDLGEFGYDYSTPYRSLDDRKSCREKITSCTIS